jgi:hypothetical protein
MPSLQLRKRVPSLALVAEVTMKQRKAHKVKNALLSLMGLPFFAFRPMEKCPNALLRASVSDNYDASEWTFIIMSDTRYQIVALGFVAK